MIRQFIVRDGAFLWATARQPVVLSLQGLNYQTADKVPDGLLAKWQRPDSSTAGHFVSEIMRDRFGGNRSAWPELAVAFCATAGE